MLQKSYKEKFGKCQLVYYNEIIGKHKSGNIYTKLETIKSQRA